MSHQPLVSIGVPTYNRAERLRTALESAIAQDYPNLEIIISDNASTDDTAAVCTEFAERYSHIRYVRQPTNRGAAANFMEVLHQAQGPLFIWLADDDRLDSDYISQCAQVLIDDPSYALACGLARYTPQDGKQYDGVSLNLVDESPTQRVIDYYTQITENGTFYGVARRDYLLKLSAPDAMGGDWLFIAAIAFLGKIKTLEHTRIHRNFTHWRGFDALASHLGWHPFQGKHPHLSIALSAFYDILWLCPIYTGLEPSERLTLATQIHQILCQRGNVRPAHVVDLLSIGLERLRSQFPIPRPEEFDHIKQDATAIAVKHQALWWGDVMAASHPMERSLSATHLALQQLEAIGAILSDQIELSEQHYELISAELERSRSQHLITHNELLTTHHELQNMYEAIKRWEERHQAATERFQTRIGDLKTKLTDTQQQLQEARTELDAIKASRFWKLLTQWSKLKSKLGFK